mmetsp:Transcript_30109/g.54924  ORF Transcript_30109/g.54924 Transcript_30109/m.54924 type:complete len:229 (-) Transcript_30109:320-1006(-)
MLARHAMVLYLPALVTLVVRRTDAKSNAWINEFHYHTVGRDGDGFVEVFLRDAESASDYKLEFYSSASGDLTFSRSLAGCDVTELPSKKGKLVVMQDLRIGRSNADAIALINTRWLGEDAVLEFISVDGVCTPSIGKGYAAEGLTSIDIDVSEAGTTNVGLSLQRGDTDVVGTWVGPLANTRGRVNESAGQLISTTTSASSSAMSTTLDLEAHDIAVGLRGSKSLAVM